MATKRACTLCRLNGHNTPSSAACTRRGYCQRHCQFRCDHPVAVVRPAPARRRKRQRPAPFEEDGADDVNDEGIANNDDHGTLSAMDSYVQTLAVNGEVHLLAKAADSSVFALRACHFLLKKGEGTAYEELRYPELQKV